MDRLINPYRPGAGTTPPALVGRDHLIDEFGVVLRRAMARRPGKSLMLIGLRGVGKTVTLNRFVEIAEHEGAQAVFVEAPESGGLSMQLASGLRKMLLDIGRGPLKAVAERALRALRSFVVQLPDGSAVAFGVEPEAGLADSGILSEDLTDVLVSVGEAVAEIDSGLLVAIDEVQYLPKEEFAALITAIHRTVQRDLPVVLVGTGLPQLPRLAGEAKSYAERLFKFPEVGSLDDDQAAEALRRPAEELGVYYELDALRQIVQTSKGYPYFLQEWGHQVWDEAASSPIILADVNAAAPGVTADLDSNFFRVRFDRLTPKEKKYLQAMAALGPGPHRSGDIAGQLGVKVQSVAPRRAGLISKGMVYSPTHGETAFTVPLFDEFLKRISTGS